MSHSIGHGAIVRHAQFGLGQVNFAREGFAKVKVVFEGTERKVAVEELILESPSSADRVHISAGRNQRSLRPAPRRHPQVRLVSVAQPLAVATGLPERLARVTDSWRHELAGKAARPAWRTRLHYDDAEVELAFLVARSPEGKDDLASLLGRTGDAIDLLWRWCDMAQFPERAGNEIQRQVAAIRARLGDEARGCWPVVPDAILALCIVNAA